VQNDFCNTIPPIADIRIALDYVWTSGSGSLAMFAAINGNAVASVPEAGVKVSGVASKSTRPFAKIDHPTKVTITANLPPDQAIDSYRYWEKRLGQKDFVFGQFGENFTVEALPDDEVCIG
jgi:hypothetical protein